MAKSKKARRYTDAEKARILAAIANEGLTGKQASKKFGVSEVTLWKWRRDAKGTRRTRRPKAVRHPSASNGSLDGLLRSEVRDRIRELLPELVREEVASYVRVILGHSR